MARLSKEQLIDRTRYQFKAVEVDLPEIGGSVEVKTLSVKERDAMPDLVDENGKPDADLDDLAAVWAVVVSDPKMSTEEAKGFLGELPATALDTVIEKFGNLLGGSEEDVADTRRDFHKERNGSQEPVPTGA